MKNQLILKKNLFAHQGYMKAVKTKLQETNPDRVSVFEKGAQAYAKKIVAKFDDYEFVSNVYFQSPTSPLSRNGSVHHLPRSYYQLEFSAY
jgi:dethiobiotin synthetase